MIFTIEQLSPPRRLLKSFEWRDIKEDYSLKGRDFYTSNHHEVTKICASNELRGGSRVFRKDFPEVPDKPQLVSVIRNADMEQTNHLILNINGKFELRQNPFYDKNKNDPSIAVLFGSFEAGNDHIGADAAIDKEHISRLYCTMLRGWISHLESGITQIHYNYVLGSNLEKELLEEIAALRAAWKPQY